MVSQGLSFTINAKLDNGLNLNIGATIQDIYEEDNGAKRTPEFTESIMGTWNIGYIIPRWHLRIDYTGNLISPMKLPLISDLDPRPDMSPWWSIQNIQLSKSFKEGVEIFGGVKNLLNWTPADNVPFIIARPDAPFDETPDAQGLLFNPEYVYAPNQAIRAFVGFRYNLN